MGGRIGLESKAGEGSTFWFTAHFIKQSAEHHPSLAPITVLKGVRVLSVDDHMVNRILVSRLLDHWGCLHDEATDGSSALDMLSKAAQEGTPYNIALIDMQMPGMDGMQLGALIKKSPDIRDTRLVMMTSLGMRGDMEQLAQAGFSGYLTKPLRQNQLHDCMALVMGAGEDAAYAPGPQGIVTRHTVAEARGRRVRILLVEDNTINQLVALKMLEKMGYRADSVTNGIEAITALKTIPYDLVLMDCQMPEMDGFEATRRIREPGSSVLNPKVIIIAMTAHAMKGDKERCLDVGMDDYISKPVNSVELTDMIERWLTLSPPPIKAISPPEPLLSRELPPKPVFDKDGFMERIMDDEEFAIILVQEYLGDLPKQLSKLGESIMEGDSVQAGQRAHTIKGASLNMGGLLLADIALTMELAGKAGDIQAVGALLPEMERQMAIFAVELRKSWPEV